MFHTAIPIELNIMDLAQTHETHATTEDNPDNYYPVGSYPFGDSQISETTMAILQDLYGTQPNNSDKNYLDLDITHTDNQYYSPYKPDNNFVPSNTNTQNKPIVPINSIPQNNPNQSTSEQGDTPSIPPKTENPTAGNMPNATTEEQETQPTKPTDNNEPDAAEEKATEAEDNTPTGQIISTRPTIPNPEELIGNKGKDIIDSMYSKNIAASVNKLVHNLSANKEMKHYIITHHHVPDNTTQTESSNTTNTATESISTTTPEPNTTEPNSESDDVIVAEIDSDTYITFFSIKSLKPK